MYVVILNSGYGKTFLAKKFSIFNDFSGHFFDTFVYNKETITLRNVLDCETKINLINPTKMYNLESIKNCKIILPIFNEKDKKTIYKNFIKRESVYYNDFIYKNEKREKKEKIRDDIIKKNIFYSFEVKSLETFPEELINYINNTFGESFELS